MKEMTCKSIFEEYKAGMENIYNSFFISFLALKPLQERPLHCDYIIPISGFSFSTLEARQLNCLQDDSINEYVNSIRRHMLNDIMICYERYASLMYTFHIKGSRIDYANLEDRTLNSAKFESLQNVFSKQEKEFIIQLRRLRNSIVHYNGVYNKSNLLKYTFYNYTYDSQGHEGENIQIDLDSIMYIYNTLFSLVTNIHSRYENQQYNFMQS